MIATRRALAMLLAASLAAGCAAALPLRAAEVRPKETHPKWLAATDKIDPAIWLADHEAGHPAEEAAAERLRGALSEARAYFLETPRMVANRTAQLGDMLAEVGLREDYAELLAALSRVAAAAPARQTYGELCQQYFNLRRAGEERSAALAALLERYGAQRRP